MQSTQASRIIAKFINARKLAALLGCAPAKIYKWTYPRERGGTDGYVPHGAIKDIQLAAELEGIILTDADWAP